MKIQNKEEVITANKRFNYFHDGFIKRILIASGNKFVTGLPWEKKRTYKTKEEKLLETGLSYGENTSLELVISHYNYDWPNQPISRAIHIRTNDAIDIIDNLSSFAGKEIFDLRFKKRKNQILCILTFHDTNTGFIHNMKNGIRTVLFKSSQLDIKESICTK